MVKINRLLKDIFFSALTLIVYTILFMYIVPLVFSRILGYEEEIFVSSTYIALASISIGLSIASKYVVKPLKIVFNVLISIISILIVFYVTNNGLFSHSVKFNEYTIRLQLDFSIIIYVLSIFLLTLAVISAILPRKS